ncbi:N-carbamoyl-L-amino-acid hydrolase [Micromonospora phaseoli]|uniref:N-carbamoyl-L-amino-acid hydrolase n=1 Tax=Micromonospora phaseoli TaxID=1144548 RepID=A0A1H7CSH2_9ACTN|nr:allantoate amidohydrolase [Micromonospora phaseoli]PZV91531.1 N-carbamoyl-L-amino-acid hydrolase [Micromonospora phaseoli]GIJ80061.1 Zn-dependent hydrolase [Micromonospora phaseoli]SEJ92673.1 N-carbamoyl-L-amino-acid hydrolase [Micromonospora phaseoli]
MSTHTVEEGSLPDRFRKLWDEIAPIGRDPGSGGYLRYALTEPELRLRGWFREQADARDMPVREDGNGNLFAWWGDPDAGDAVLTGSHFDSVPHGGAYDGPLGIVSAWLAVDELRAAGVAPARPLVVGAFVEEEGARFGVPCLGSRLLTGQIAPERAAGLRDAAGVSFAEALGDRPAGADPALLGRLAAFVELHVEQGRALVDQAAPVAVASAIWPHGRWRFEVTGEGNHAGTTRMADRRDPMLTYAFTVLAANKEARLRDAHATVGRVAVEPNATNAIPSRVTGWLDARAAEPETLTGLVEAVRAKAAERARRDGTEVTVVEESATPLVAFDGGLADRLAQLLHAPVLPTGAGHDAGVLAAHVPTAMLFVRNPTGVSHSPAESATDVDCAAGVTALARVLEDLTG